MELSLKIILASEPNGKWGVKWVGVNPCEEVGLPPPQAHENNKNLTQPNLKQVRPTLQQNTVNPVITQPKPKITAPKPKMVWAPRARGLPNSEKVIEASTSSPPEDFTHDLGHDRVSLHSWDSESQLSLSSAAPDPSTENKPIDEIMQGVGMVDRSWGTPRDWFLDLRDGRRLRIPVDI